MVVNDLGSVADCLKIRHANFPIVNFPDIKMVCHQIEQWIENYYCWLMAEHLKGDCVFLRDTKSMWADGNKSAMSFWIKARHITIRRGCIWRGMHLQANVTLVWGDDKVDSSLHLTGAPSQRAWQIAHIKMGGTFGSTNVPIHQSWLPHKCQLQHRAHLSKQIKSGC